MALQKTRRTNTSSPVILLLAYLSGLKQDTSAAPTSLYSTESVCLNAAGIMRSMAAPLTRNHAALALRAHLEAQPGLGLCHKNVSLQDQLVSHQQCVNIPCIYSSKCNMAYSMDSEFFRPIPAADDSACPMASGGQLEQPNSPVQVSFIIPFHNHVIIATQCLLELYLTAAEITSAEFFVIDDGSTEDILVMKQAIQLLVGLFDAPIKLIRNVQSLGFGGSSMACARSASGKFISFVNSDAFVGKGWLAAILATFDKQPEAGLVGPLFLGKGMIVAEGGGIVWSDGTAGNYYRGQSVSHNVTFMRPVDYISAALVLIRRDAFETVGGLDPRYGRGYFEDTDLAMALRLHGFKVSAVL